MKKHPAGKSPRTKGHQVLGMISSARVESLVYEWVNLPERALYASDLDKPHPAYEKLLGRYPEVFPFSRKGEAYRVMMTVREGLRQIWNTSDARQRDWVIFSMRNLYERSRTREEHGLRELFEAQSDNDFLPPLPRLSPFEAAMVHLQGGLTHRLLYCPNPDCAAPFFFRTKKSQKACSPECADWLRRKSKLRWYHQAPNSPKNR
jgi:hypothetical protein